MLDVTLTFYLLQMVDNPTRVEGIAGSISDVFFESGDIQSHITCEATNGISDHKAVLLCFLNICFYRQKTIHSFANFPRADDELL